MRVDQRRVGERIRRLRQEKGLSQREVAQPAMSAAYLSLIEGGQRPASEKALGHIASKLGVDRDELVLGKPTGTEGRLELQLQEARAAAHRGNLERAEELLVEVEAESARYKMATVQAKALTQLGSLALSADEVERASDLFIEALELMRECAPHQKFEALVGAAQVHHAQGDTRMAVHMLESYLIGLRQARAEDPQALMRVNSALVQFYRALGMYSQATSAASEAMRLSPQVEDPEQLACMSMNVGRALYEDGKHDEAVDALKRAEQLYQMLDWPLPTIRARINKGMVQFGKEQLDDAKESFGSALAALDDYPNQKLIRADVLNELARVERLLNNPSRAQELLTEARSYLKRANLIERAFNEREMGLTLAPEDLETAKDELRRSARNYLSAGAQSEAAQSLLELGRLLREQGNDGEAAAVLQEGLELASS